MFGGAKKYSGKKAGDRFQLKNGAMVEVQANGRFKFVKGGDKAKLRAHLNKIRGTHPRITKRSATRAFNKHYAGKKTSHGRTQDLNYGRNDRLVSDSRYRRSPHIYEYKGVDMGKKRHPRLGKRPGQKGGNRNNQNRNNQNRNNQNRNNQNNNNQNNNNQENEEQDGGAKRGRPRGSKNSRKPRSPHCGFDKGNKLCSKRMRGKSGQHCFLSGKTNHCRKRSSAPKAAARVARGKALLASLGKKRRVCRGRAGCKQAGGNRNNQNNNNQNNNNQNNNNQNNNNQNNNNNNNQENEEQDGGAKRGRPRGSKNSRKPRSPHCGYNKKTFRCNKKSSTGRQHCFRRSKTNRCRGRSSKPKNPKNVARGKALLKSLGSRRKTCRGRGNCQGGGAYYW